MQTLWQTNWDSVHYFWPTLLLAITAGLIVVQDLFEDTQTWAAPLLALLGVGGAGYLLFRMGPPTMQPLFAGMAVLDPFSRFFHVFFLVVAGLTVFMSARSREISENKGEYYAILLVATAGMILMASATDLLMLYLALETVSLSSYVLTGWVSHSKKSSEASLKYVLYGAVASGVMLYGLSILYGWAGSTDYEIVGNALKQAPNSFTASLAALLVFAGFGYKIASVPFHMWAPDVYEGAPTPITAFLTVGSKAAGFAAMIRFFYVVMATRVPGLESVGASWTASVAPAWPILIGLLALVTMTVGNLSALHQTNVKRLLGYSSIAHAGYLLLGFVVLSEEGLRSMLFYLIVYCAMNIGAFLVVGAVADETGSEDVSAFKGLGRRSPFAAVSMTIFLFSLVGLPPLAGFAGKLHLFVGVIHRAMAPGEGLEGYSWFFYLLAIAAVVNSVISLVYYAKIVKTMFLESVEGTPRPVHVAPLYVALMGFLVMPTLFLGLFWEGTLTWAQNSIAFFGGQ